MSCGIVCPKFPSTAPKSDQIYPTALFVFFVCGCATSKWSDVLFWEMICLNSHKIIPKSIRCKEYIDVSNCPTWMLLRIHAKLKHGLDRFVRNSPYVQNSTPLPYFLVHWWKCNIFKIVCHARQRVLVFPIDIAKSILIIERVISRYMYISTHT